MLPEIERLLFSQWDELYPKLSVPSKLQFLVMASSPAHISYAAVIKVFVFKNNDRNPFLLGKISDKEKYRFLIKRECDNLNKLDKLLPDGFRQTIPKLILQGKINDYSFFLENFFDGKVSPRNINLKKKKCNPIEEIDEIIEWLVKFQKHTKSGYQDNFEEIVDKYQEEYSKRYKIGIEANYFERLKDYSREINGLKIPIVLQHGDYWSNNIINTDEGIKVIDWANCETGNPFDDLFLLISSFLLSNEKGFRAGETESFDHCFFIHNWFSALLNKMCYRHFQQIGVDFQTIKFFFPLFLLKMATRKEEFGTLEEKVLVWKEKFEMYIKNEGKFLSVWFSDYLT